MSPKKDVTETFYFLEISIWKTESPFENEITRH